MSLASHQTVRLSRGRHASADEGACVMELASMLAHERFSDRPRSVCPVIAEFLRTYNDRVDDERRQDLYPYAAAVVGTRAGEWEATRRARLCVLATHGTLGLSGRLRAAFKLSAAREAAIVFAQRVADGGHRQALALLDEMVAVGRDAQARPPMAASDPDVDRPPSQLAPLA